jgi:hypothetical protein
MFNMKSLLLILILTFSFQTVTKADDIKDFQIEGISLGDNLLNYFDKNLIEAEKYNEYSLMYKNDKYVQIGAGNKKKLKLNVSSKTYDDLSIILKTVDNTYKVYSIGGRIFCEDINACKLKKKQIVSDLKIFFGDDVTIEDVVKNHSADPTGNSKNFSTFFNFNSSNDYVQVSIYDWSKKMKYRDNLKITIIGAEFRYFLENVQYNN